MSERTFVWLPSGRARRACAGLLACVACGDGAPPRAGPTTPGPPAPTTIEYRVPPPAGKLPWPQHDPAFTRAQHDSMMRALTIGNNFALYQVVSTPQTSYLHNGVDLALPLGTPIYAVESGRVRHVDDRPGDYQIVVVEDEDEPGHGWGYAHVDSIAVRIGDRVPQGARLATTRFLAYPHLHLDRMHLTPGGSWRNLYQLTTTQPDTFFHYADTRAPLFERGVHYFRNESDSVFARPTGPAGRPVVDGDVDIVVGMRDPGEHGSPPNRSDDRQAPTRVEYAITPVGRDVGATERRKSFDLRTLVLQRTPDDGWRYALLLFKDRRAVETSQRATSGFISFYTITNVPPEGRTGRLALEDGAHAWRTAERDAGGRARFPDGEYVVSIWAWDFLGNVAAHHDTVRVRNDGPR